MCMGCLEASQLNFQIKVITVTLENLVIYLITVKYNNFTANLKTDLIL